MHVSRIVAVVVGVVLVLATGLAAALGFSYDARQRDVAGADARRAARQSLTSELERVVANTRQVAGLFAASHAVSAAEFRTFTTPMLLDGSVAAFAWIPRVREADRARWERVNRLLIVESRAGRFVPAPPRATHDPLLMLQTLYDATVPPYGADVASSPVRLRALRAAAASGEPRATPVLRLAGTDKEGMLIFAPVRGRAGELLGSAVGTARVAQLAGAMAGVLPKGAAFELRAGGRRVAGHGRLGARAERWTVDIGGRRLDVVTSGAPPSGLSAGVIALVVGGLLTALVVLGLSGLVREAGRAERKASRSEERFVLAFDHAPVGMALLDSATRHVKVNEAMARMLGHTRESLAGLGAEQIMPPGDAAACQRLVAALLRGDQPAFAGDTTLLTVDGRHVRVAVHMTLLEQTAAGDPPILVHTVDVTEQRMAERRMKHLAHHDPLTGLLNRRGFSEALQRRLAHTRRYASGGALLILDLDGFKAVNDVLGHEAGDRLLVQVGEELGACLRETDVVARLGGDEFAVILPRETLDEAAIVAAKITGRLRAAALGAAPGVRGVTASIGVAALADGFEEADDVLRAADLAMYSAKAAGRDRHAVHGRHTDLV